MYTVVVAAMGRQVQYWQFVMYKNMQYPYVTERLFSRNIYTI